MGAIVLIPNPSDVEERFAIEEFDTYEEALEWAADMLEADEEGKIQVVFETEEDNDY